MIIIFYVVLFVLGACFGSFLCCQARRLHYNASHKAKLQASRSICLHCHHQLKWYDNIPIISWLILRGKCRKCKTKFGIAELLSELGTGLALLALGTTFDFAAAGFLAWVSFCMLVVFTLSVIFLAIYDGLYGELPTKCLIISIVLALVVLALQYSVTLTTSPFTLDYLWRPLTSVGILGGLYLLLYLISKSKWVGDGDWLLATALAIVLADPWPALITLFLANLLACLVMLPAMIISKTSKSHKIYFGPFLVVAFVITYAIIGLW